MICSSCGYAGSPQKNVKGSIAIEIVLWLCFIIPGLIYSIWRLSSQNQICPKCKNQTMIPLDTPNGRKMLTEQGKNVDQAVGESHKMIEAKNKRDKKLLLILCILVFGIIFLKVFFISN